jgi:hypothetical protein
MRVGAMQTRCTGPALVLSFALCALLCACAKSRSTRGSDSMGACFGAAGSCAASNDAAGSGATPHDPSATPGDPGATPGDPGATPRDPADSIGGSGGEATPASWRIDAAGRGGTGGTSSTAPRCTVPHRECPGSCVALRILAGATRAPAECDGDRGDAACVFDLSLESSLVLDAGTCTRVGLALELRKGEEVERVHYAQVTDAAWDALLATARDLDVTTARMQLAPGVDCADCAGRNTSAVRLSEHGETHTFSYPPGHPPGHLRAADELLQQLIDEMIACRGDLLESECSVSQWPSVETSATTCAVDYRLPWGTSASCKIPFDAEAPCREALECLCTGTALGRGVSMSIEQCSEFWLTPRGEITFADVCAQGREQASGSLATALRTFADTQGAMVGTSAACDGMQAWY